VYSPKIADPAHDHKRPAIDTLERGAKSGEPGDFLDVPGQQQLFTMYTTKAGVCMP